MKHDHPRPHARPPALLALCAALALCASAPWPGAQEPEDSDCWECHGEDDDMDFSFADGSSLQIFVDPEEWGRSVHGPELLCQDCHRNIVDIPHGKREHGSAREYQIAMADTCKRCHYANYSRTLDGIHFEMLAQGDQDAPTCVDCHGAHATPGAEGRRVDIGKRCARCHEEIATAYKSSVHGQGLASDNQDVPGCIDCHGAHGIRDPRKESFHASSHTICARCHGDAERMGRYDLNPNVLSSYLEDFHGASNKLYSEGAGTPVRKLASCTDCHGVHDIQSMKDRKGTEQMRESVLDMCRRCHEEVPDGFADAWLSHYEPSLTRAPLVWIVRAGYRVLIPVIMLGLVLHILLHLWRLRPQTILGA